jgi:hypothetical protein
MVISPVICGAEAPPRLCDPPCSEKQAGIGPISQKPELVTMGRTYNGGSDSARSDGPPWAADRFTYYGSYKPPRELLWGLGGTGNFIKSARLVRF